MVLSGVNITMVLSGVNITMVLSGVKCNTTSAVLLLQTKEFYRAIFLRIK